MPEKDYEVVVYDVEYLCNECAQPMRVRSIVALSTDTHFEHICPEGHHEVLPERYPTKRYMRLEDD